MGVTKDIVPFYDLAPQHAAIEGDLVSVLHDVLACSQFVGGEFVRAFESAFASYTETRWCVGVGNGSDALELALRAVDVAGWDVVVPALSFVATATAVLRAGGTPVFADVEDDTGLLSPESVMERLTPRTRAIVPVHLYGQIAPVEQYLDLGSDGCVVVEDAAQSHGARRHGRKCGALAAASAVSFYPSKNLGALGDGGAVVTNDTEIADRVRLLGSYGGRRKGEHDIVGFNSRLDNLQAGFLLAKLGHLDGWLEERRRLAERYDALLAAQVRIRLPSTLDGNEHAWHLYTVRVADRRGVMARMRERGVETAVHYRLPIHLQRAFAGGVMDRVSLPHSEAWARETLSLPLYPGMTEDQQDRVIEALTEVTTDW